MESEGLILDQVECQVALVAASILEFLDDPESTSPRPAVEGGPLRKVEVAFGSLIKLMSGDCAARAIAECLSEMKDFLKLMLTLMKEMIASKDFISIIRITACNALSELYIEVMVVNAEILITWYLKIGVHATVTTPYQ